MQQVELWTDGSCPRNPGGPGGWAAVLRFTDALGVVHERELSDGEESTTNNRMELMAVIEGLCALKQPCAVTVHTDSTYVIDGMKMVERWKAQGWRTMSGPPVRNVDLWSALQIACAVHVVQWVWVRGHDGSEHNERCDDMAGRVARSIMERAEKLKEGQPTTAQRVREKQEAIAMAPHLELDKELDRAVALDDEREKAA